MLILHNPNNSFLSCFDVSGIGQWIAELAECFINSRTDNQKNNSFWISNDISISILQASQEDE